MFSRKPTPRPLTFSMLPQVPGYRVVKSLGVHCETCIIGTGVFSNMANNISDALGSKSSSMVNKTDRAVKEAFSGFEQRAQKLPGCNAVICVTIDFETLEKNQPGVMVSGEFVMLEPYSEGDKLDQLVRLTTALVHLNKKMLEELRPLKEHAPKGNPGTTEPPSNSSPARDIPKKPREEEEPSTVSRPDDPPSLDAGGMVLQTKAASRERDWSEQINRLK